MNIYEITYESSIYGKKGDQVDFTIIVKDPTSDLWIGGINKYILPKNTINIQDLIDLKTNIYEILQKPEMKILGLSVNLFFMKYSEKEVEEFLNDIKNKNLNNYQIEILKRLILLEKTIYWYPYENNIKGGHQNFVLEIDDLANSFSNLFGIISPILGIFNKIKINKIINEKIAGTISTEILGSLNNKLKRIIVSGLLIIINIASASLDKYYIDQKSKEYVQLL
ncbi:MAG: hypothetical protein ACP5KX_01020 [Caldisericia bacterium]